MLRYLMIIYEGEDWMDLAQIGTRAKELSTC